MVIHSLSDVGAPDWLGCSTYRFGVPPLLKSHDARRIQFQACS
jgi:hypothetical protein